MCPECVENNKKKDLWSKTTITFTIEKFSRKRLRNSLTSYFHKFFIFSQKKTLIFFSVQPERTQEIVEERNHRPLKNLE